MRHYLFLSVPQLVRKYANREFEQSPLEMGWHGWRTKVRGELIRLPSQSDLRPYVDDDHLDTTTPRRTHFLDDLLAAPNTQVEASGRRGDS
jgi:hypothetical protein